MYMLPYFYSGKDLWFEMSEVFIPYIYLFKTYGEKEKLLDVYM